MILQLTTTLLLLNFAFDEALASKGSQSLIRPSLGTVSLNRSLEYSLQSQPRSYQNEAYSFPLKERALRDGGVTFPPSEWFNIVSISILALPFLTRADLNIWSIRQNNLTQIAQIAQLMSNRMQTWYQGEVLPNYM